VQEEQVAPHAQGVDVALSRVRRRQGQREDARGGGAQEIAYPLAFCRAARAGGRSAPPIIPDHHVDTAIVEKLHGFVIFVPPRLMQDTGGLMGARPSMESPDLFV
jgi:hypothetical protein